MTADAWAAVVAGLALAVSIMTARKSSKIGNRQNDLQERLLALESTRERQRLRKTKSADVRAAIVSLGRGSHRLRIVNDGPSTARNVTVELDDAPMMEHDWVLRGQGEAVSTLGSGVDASYLLAVTHQSPMKAHIKVSWDDDTGEPREWESELKV